MSLVFPVRVCRPEARPAAEDQLAWKIAELAASPRPVDPAAAEMAACRLIDNAAVALAALNRAPVAAARAQAMCFPRAGGARVIGLGEAARVDCLWAAMANATAVRELDFHDSYFALDSSHPADCIMPLLAVAQQARLTGADLVRGILTSYEVQTALVRAFPLQHHRIDHVAHLGPAVAAGLGAMLGLAVPVIYEAVNLAAHLSLSTRQVRKGRISSWKAAAPGHIGKTAIEAIDRAMRGETAPSPIYEGDYGILAVLLKGAGGEVTLPDAGQPCRAILDTLPKAHSAGYHGQAIIDLAINMRPKVPDPAQVESITLHTKRMTHMVMGSGAGDPDKWDPAASRETLDHSAPFQFARALVDGAWHHDRSYDPARISAPDFVALWRKVETVEDPDWNRRFDAADPLDKAHGARAVIRFSDGRSVEEELAVANSHPRGAAPWGPADYRGKFLDLTADCLSSAAAAAFLAEAGDLAALDAARLHRFGVAADLRPALQGPPGLFERGAE
ncbi:MmgE/PrpD family protein [Aliigemmobacter aestuarii]|uniref:MmgE/PrpD family protein n=1 Tax=Aliigemmobacter aestuarii TaxID=1445661 RepID=A0A4S3MKP1_9RHOB|nr:MmgE/PrpD family protein [Gemmobacter aestuarii]THD82764.1 MmgE/PrpD family protein [Gemmobacter aestuarii]